MTLKNRVQPDGLITDTPMRGLFTGNRGILHVEDHVMGASLWKHRAWICCTLNWKGRRRDVMRGRNWTELFFLDEAVAMAAGHRPCAYCRRKDYTAFSSAWGENLTAPEMDARLHTARAVRGGKHLQTHRAQAQDLPAGTFIRTDAVLLLTADAALPYAPQGYGAARPRPLGEVTLLTAPPMVQVLRRGYAPALHPSAQTPLFP